MVAVSHLELSHPREMAARDLPEIYPRAAGPMAEGV